MPLIIGFGYKARRGKDTACNAIIEALGAKVDVRKYAFADALREEIEKEIYYITEIHGDTPAQAIQYLCSWAGVPYDHYAVADAVYPHGKQRALTQWWGTEYRRAQDPDYWVKQLAAKIAADAPAVAVISDVRFLNEFRFIAANGGYNVRVDRPGFEIADGQHHISEVGLDALPAWEWDDVLINDGDEQQLKADAVHIARHFRGQR